MAAAMPSGQFAEAIGAGHMVHADNGGWLIETIVNWLSKP